MKLRIVCLCLVLGSSVLSLSAQKNKPAPPPDSDPQWQVYRTALGYGDVNVAIHALYQILAKNPTDNAIKDSLATLYFTSGFASQSLLVGLDILKSDPNNVKMLELTAISYSSLGYVKQSVDQYDKLYNISHQPYHLYQLAVQQYALKRYEECAQSLNNLIADPKSAEEKITIDGDAKKQQRVSLKAAAYNVLGVAHRDLGKIEPAKNYFQEALKIEPDFILPKNNLADMEAKANPAAPNKK